MSGFWLGLLCLAFLVMAYALRRANELFALAAHSGKLSVLRGRLPPALFSDLAEIAARERADALEIRVVSEAGVPRLVVRGITHAQRSTHGALEQAARNVLGRFSVAQIRAGRRRAGA